MKSRSPRGHFHHEPPLIILLPSGVTGGARRARHPPGKLNVKKCAPMLACISVFSILLILSRILLAFFKIFSECFPVISGVTTDESS